MSAIEDLQRLVFGRLLSYAPLATVSVILSRPRIGADGNLISDTAIKGAIEKALGPLASRGGKSGAVIEVTMPAFDSDGAGAAVNQGKLAIGVIIRENPVTNMGANGTQISAEQIAEHCMAAVDQTAIAHTNGEGRKSSAAITLPKDAMRPFGEEGVAMVGYQLVFERRIVFGRPARVSAPAIAVAAGNATITCATAGATIRYTLNGEYPGSAAEIPGVQIYTVPVAVASGETLRAVGSKADFGDSDVASITV